MRVYYVHRFFVYDTNIHTALLEYIVLARSDSAHTYHGCTYNRVLLIGLYVCSCRIRKSGGRSTRAYIHTWQFICIMVFLKNLENLKCAGIALDRRRIHRHRRCHQPPPSSHPPSPASPPTSTAVATNLHRRRHQPPP